MLDSILGVLGLGYAAALVLLAVTVFTEQAGAARSPEEDEGRHRGSAIALWAANVLTPLLLLAHAFTATSAHEDMRLEAMIAPVLALLGGALIGAIFGAMAPGASPLMRRVMLPLALIALAAALYAAWPSAREILGMA
jgi:hypothetical protein